MPYVIPPWIRAADPAAHEAQGMHIGLQASEQELQERTRQQAAGMRQAQFQQQMDAEAASQRFKEVQAARMEQEQAQAQALQEQKFSLLASQAAQKHQAMQEYQAALASGADPNEAMSKFGPAMAANTGAAAAIRAHERENRVPKTWNEVTMPSGLSTLQSSSGDIRFPPRTASGAPEDMPTVVDVNGVPMLKVPNANGGFHYQNAPRQPAVKSGLTPMQMMMERDKTEKALGALLDANATFDLSEAGTPPKKASAVGLARWKAAKAQADKLRKRIDEMETRMAGGEPAAGPTPESPPHDETGVIDDGTGGAGAPLPTTSKAFKVGGYTVTPL